MDYFERRRQSLYNYYSEDYNNDYINDIIVENYIDSDYEFVSEGIGDIVDSIKEKINNAIKKIKEIWQKFKNWIKNLFNVIVNMFTSGKKLVANHESDIREAYNAKKSVIKFNGHIYSLNKVQDLTKKIEDLLNNVTKPDDIRKDMDDMKQNVGTMETTSEDDVISAFTNNQAKDRAGLVKYVASFVRDTETKNHSLSDIPIDDLIDLTGNGKEVMKSIKETEKNTDKAFKEAISNIKNTKSDYSEDKDAIKVIDNVVKHVKMTSSIASSSLKTLISEIKAGNRMYTGLVRKLLDGRVKGSNDDDDEAPKNEPPKNEPPKADTNKPDPNGGNRGLRGAKRYVELQKQKNK